MEETIIWIKTLEDFLKVFDITESVNLYDKFENKIGSFKAGSKKLNEYKENKIEKAIEVKPNVFDIYFE